MMNADVKDDPVRAYLERHGYASYIVEGGVEYLLMSWESTAASIADGDVLDFNAYLKCMDRRRILEETLGLIPPEQQSAYVRRVKEADAQIKPHLIRIQEPLCGRAIAAEQGYIPECHWWYYHRPSVMDSTWPYLA